MVTSVPRMLMVHASSDLYGSDLVCLRVARAAVEAGWDVEAIAPGDGPLIAEFAQLGIAVHDIDPLKPRRADLAWPTLLHTPIAWVTNLVRLRCLARRRRGDLVYTTTAPTLGGFVLARRWRVPHIYHVHEIFWQPPALVRRFERLLASTDAVLCASTPVRDQFHDRALLERCHVVWSGADVPGGIAERVPLAADHLDIVCVARLTPLKGHSVLIDAVADLRRRGLDARLRLVGDVYRTEHHHRQRLEEQVRRLALERHVTFEGERRDALDLVAQADVFVLASVRPEAFGMAVVEAMALGRPVVATALGGPTEIVRDGVDGLLVPPGDPVALADAIARLVADPAAARVLATRARARALEFSSGAMASAVLDVLGSALATTRPT